MRKPQYLLGLKNHHSSSQLTCQSQLQADKNQIGLDHLVKSIKSSCVRLAKRTVSIKSIGSRAASTDSVFATKLIYTFLNFQRSQVSYLNRFYKWENHLYIITLSLHFTCFCLICILPHCCSIM